MPASWEPTCHLRSRQLFLPTAWEAFFSVSQETASVYPGLGQAACRQWSHLPACRAACRWEVELEMGAGEEDHGKQTSVDGEEGWLLLLGRE